LKSRTSILCAALAICATVSAGALSFAGGLRAGASGSILTGAYVDSINASLTDRGAGTLTTRPYLSYRVDGFFRLNIVDFFAIQAEVGFGPVGGGVLASNGLDLLVGISGNELSVPLLAVFSLTTPVGTFSLMAGGFAAYSLGDPQYIENNGLVWTSTPLSPAIYAGLAGGVEYRLPLGPGSLLVDVRYTHRLMSMLPGDAALTPLALELTAGYMFRFGK
jgi:hypothetical protein